MTRTFHAWLLALFSLAACGGSGASTTTSGGGDDASADAGPGDAAGDSAPDAQPCVAPRKTCAGACVDTSTDATNCGDCGHACTGAGQVCAAGSCVAGPIVLAIKKLYLGDTDRNGAASPTAWKSYGLDIDGKTTTAASTDVCTLAAGAARATQADGNGGIDNSFGENILPIWLSVVSNFAQTVNDGITSGKTETTLLAVSGITAQPDAPSAPASVFVGAPFGVAPKWDGTDVWPVDSTSVNNGDITMPALTFAQGAMASRVWTGAPPAVAASLPMLFIGDAQVLVSHVQMSMTIAQDGRSAVSGTISGVIPTDAYIAAFKKVAGRISTSLCQGSALDAVTQQLRQAADILRDGSNMAGVGCEAISIGLGFDASIVRLGGVVTLPTPPNPCP